MLRNIRCNGAWVAWQKTVLENISKTEQVSIFVSSLLYFFRTVD